LRPWSWLVFATFGCNHAAVLEVELEVRASDEAGYLAVQAGPATLDFDETWQGYDLDVVALDPGTTRYALSAVTEHPDQDLLLRVRRCLTADCTHLPTAGTSERADPQVEYRLAVERPFFLARRDAHASHLRLALDLSDDAARCTGCEPCASPEARTHVCPVSRCSVAACVDAPGAAGTTYCEADAEGVERHLCEL
jgi:hypothetical protein